MYPGWKSGYYCNWLRSLHTCSDSSVSQCQRHILYRVEKIQVCEVICHVTCQVKYTDLFHLFLCFSLLHMLQLFGCVATEITHKADNVSIRFQFILDKHEWRKAQIAEQLVHTHPPCSICGCQWSFKQTQVSVDTLKEKNKQLVNLLTSLSGSSWSGGSVISLCFCLKGGVLCYSQL